MVSRREYLATVTVGIAGLVGGTGVSKTEVVSESAPRLVPEPSASTEIPARRKSAWRADEAQIPRQDRAAAAVPPYPPRPDPAADNPVLTADDVTDADAAFVADPFIFVTRDGDWHMFFEVLAEYGVVGHATSDDGVAWEYDRIVLDLESHTSFPYVFEYEGHRYLLCQRDGASTEVRLYRASAFPTEWELVTTLFDAETFGNRIGDNPVFCRDGRWWMFGYGYDGRLDAYYADELTGTWRPHGGNPVVSDRIEASRPAGRPVVREDDVVVFFQNVEDLYGEKVRAYRVTELTPDSYADEECDESPVLDGTAADQEDADEAWNSLRMHHYDPWYLGEGEGWRAAVDGTPADGEWSIGIYHVPE